MKALVKIINKYPVKFLLLFYFVLHVGFFNINVAEWGDSYRILRASLFIDELSYPSNEKRPPLFSALIALFPQQPDPVFWGRVSVLILGTISFFIFLRLLELFLKKQNTFSLSSFYLGAFLFTFNPVLFYWSLRVMGDVMFLFWALVGFYIFYFVKRPLLKSFFVAVVVVLSIMTRFEGYLLLGAFGLDYLVKFIRTKNFKELAVYVATVVLLVLPYFLWQNPLTSSYVDEPGNRVYDINTFFVFVLAFVFVLGGLNYLLFLKLPSKKFYKSNVALVAYLVVQFILVLLWPAAVPRLFIPMIPFLIIFAVINLENFFNTPSHYKNKIYAVLSMVLIAVYVGGQFYYKQQFLLVNKVIFGLVILISIASLAFLFFQKKKHYYLSLVVIAVIWSLTVIFNHKDMYYTLIETSKYMLTNIKGNVMHNDTGAVMSWYITYLYPNDQLKGDYVSIHNDDMVPYDRLVENYDYLIITNEEKPFFTFNPDEDILKEVYKSEKYTNGAFYSTKIYKVKK